MAFSTSILIVYFQRIHQKVYGMPYMVSYGKDNKIMQQVIQTYGVENGKKLIDLYFGMLSHDAFLKGAGASIGVFKSQIAKLVPKLSKLTEKEKKGKWI